MDDAFKTKMQALIDDHAVVVFMKGTKAFPQCGFSATVAEVMKRLGVDFKDVNILADGEVRAGMKEYSSWPTFPQVYVGGKFVGGCDIVRDMYTNGELEPLVRAAVEAKTGPTAA
jgi:monothiol glutaredoxin